MRVLSVDIGWRHLAFADLTVTESSLSIHEWEIVDVIKDESVNVNTATTEELIRFSAPLIGAVIQRWTLSKPDVVYLENQPLGQMARNVKTKTLSHVMQALLLAQGIEVVFVSPKKKLKGMTDVGSYGDNKKFAIEASLKLLREQECSTWFEWFDTKSGKRDDLADALLQGYFAAKDSMIKKKPKAKTKRPKRDAHADTERSVQGELDFVVDEKDKLLN